MEYKSREDKGCLNLAHTSAVCCSGDKLRAPGSEPQISAEEGFTRTVKFFEEGYAERKNAAEKLKK